MIKSKSRIKDQNGFLATGVLVVLALLSVMSLLAIQRSTTSQRIVRQGLEFTDSFGTAESGVERLAGMDLEELLNSQPSGSIAGVDYELAGSGVAEGVLLREGRTFDVVVDSDSVFNLKWKYDGNLNCNSGANPTGVLMAVLGTNNQVERKIYYDAACAPPNGDNLINGAIGININNGRDINLANDFQQVNDPVRVRIKALWTPIALTVTGNNANFPNQGYTVEVEAMSDSAEATSNIIFEQSVPQLPSIFDYAVFSGDTLVQVQPTN